MPTALSSGFVTTDGWLTGLRGHQYQTPYCPYHASITPLPPIPIIPIPSVTPTNHFLPFFFFFPPPVFPPVVPSTCGPLTSFMTTSPVVPSVTPAVVPVFEVEEGRGCGAGVAIGIGRLDMARRSRRLRDSNRLRTMDDFVLNFRHYRGDEWDVSQLVCYCQGEERVLAL
jgi:hypothetical protein